MYDRHRVEVAGALRQKRLAGLDETGERGAEPKYTPRRTSAFCGLLDGPPPEGYGRWSGPLIARALGDVDVQYVWRFLRAQKIDLSGRKSWCESNDPEFAAKAADIVGLYMAPPENAIVICVDEKPSVQALERAQGYLKFANGRALTGHSHDYKRHGTSTLFAAFEVATGKVTVAHKRRRRRVEFLDFMNDIVARPRQHRSPRHPRQPQHPQAQNGSLAQASPECPFPLHTDPRLLAQPGRNLVLDPGRTVAQGRILHLGYQLREHIDAFIKAYNTLPLRLPGPKSEVHQKRLKPRFADH